jgi:hypothetical protein
LKKKLQHSARPALHVVTALGAHAQQRGGALADGTTAADRQQGFPGEPEGTTEVAQGKFMRAGPHRGGQVTRGGQRRRRAAAFLHRWCPPAAGDSGGGVPQHRGREEEMRRTANRIHAFGGFRQFGALSGGLRKPVVDIIPKSKDRFME